jgi:CheY-like chemotaxis protein
MSADAREFHGPIASAPRERPQRQGETDQRTVLVIEDDPSNRSLLVDVLAAAGYSVLQAADGWAAINLATLHRPHLILLDLVLPQLSGLDVLDELRQRESTRDIPVLVVSAFGGTFPTLAAPPVAGVIRKPFDLIALLTQVEEAMLG